jgi:hypothetical protein
MNDRSNYTQSFNIWFFLKWVLFLGALQSLKAWFFLSIDSNFTCGIMAVLLSFIALTRSDWFSLTKKNLKWTLLFLITNLIISSIHSNFYGFIAGFIRSIPVAFVIFLTEKYKIKFIKFFTKSFSIIIGISLLGWILFLFGLLTPFKIINYTELDDNTYLYIFENHYLFLLSTKNIMDAILPRFCGIFLEPGYLGGILAALLFINGWKLKYNVYNMILFLALIFTFSLAGYLLGIFGYIAVQLKNSKRRITFIIAIFAALFVAKIIVENYNNGDNIMNQLIVNRLIFDSNNGNIAGYNRSSSALTKYFYTDFIKSGDLFFGTGLQNPNLKYTDVDWRAFTIKFGIISTLLYFFYLFYPCKNFMQFVLLIIYFLNFAQTSHSIFWFIFPLIYICGVEYLKEEQTHSTQYYYYLNNK